MDTQKNINKNVIPETMTQPAQQTEVKDELDEMEMQPLPMMEQDMNSEGLPSMNMPCWHCPMMIEDTLESDVQMDEELDDMKQPAGQQMTMPQMQMQDVEEMGDTTAMRSFRGYFENYSDYDFNNFNYREYSHYDYNDHDHDHEHEYDDVDEILRKIERYNPGVFRRLASYGVPYPAARNIVRRVIRLTLNYK